MPKAARTRDTAMPEYAAEDFAQAELATHDALGMGGHGVALRVGLRHTLPWLTVLRFGKKDWATDEDMAREGWTPVTTGRPPLTLDDLEDAYEAAEIADESRHIRDGDVLIYAQRGGYTVQRAPAAYVGAWPRDIRILSRAPREPWQDLADDLADHSALMDECAIESSAKALHAAGWRKGGDRS